MCSSDLQHLTRRADERDGLPEQLEGIRKAARPRALQQGMQRIRRKSDLIDDFARPVCGLARRIHDRRHDTPLNLACARSCPPRR